MDAAQRDEYFTYWKKAVTKSFDWVEPRASAHREGRRLAPTAPSDSGACLPRSDRRPRHRRRRHRRRGRAGRRHCAASAPSWSSGATSAEGTTGRFHGLLHSGGRYVGQGPRSRRASASRRTSILRRIAADCDRGHRRPVRHDARRRPGLRRPVPRGLRDDRRAGRGDRPAEALRARAAAQPGHHAGLHRRRRVDRRLEAAVGARPRGPRRTARGSCTYHAVVGRAARRATRSSARALHDERSGEEVADRGRIHDQRVRRLGRPDRRHGRAARASSVIPGKGIMIAMNHRLVNTVVNRCTMPGGRRHPRPDPHRLRDRHDRHPRRGPRRPDDHPATRSQQMLDDGERLVPGFRQARALRVWAGVRPLFQDEKAGAARHARRQPRASRCSTTASATACSGFLTITGGKLTTLPADGRGRRRRDVRAARRRRGRAAPTQERAARARRTASYYRIGARLRPSEDHLHDDQLVCECELIPRARLEAAMRERGTHEPRRHPPQPAARAWARARAASASTARPGSCTASSDARRRRRPNELLLQLPRRSAGRASEPILYGDQLRQARAGRLDLPGPARRGAPARSRRWLPAAAAP